MSVTPYARSLALAGAVVALSVLPARADLATANKYIDAATELVGKGPQFFGDAGSKLELAEASMDDVPEAQKAALKSKIDAVRKQIATAAAGVDKVKYERQVKDLVEQIEGVVGNTVAFGGKANELTELLNDPKVVAALGEPAVADYKKQFATMQKVHQGKAIKEYLGNATEAVTQVERDWAERKTEMAAADPQRKSQLLFNTSNDLRDLERHFKNLPADNADAKALLARVEKVRAENAAATGAAGSDEAVARINGAIEDLKEDMAGSQKETGDVTWADFRKNSPQEAREFNAPKTIEFVRKGSYYLANLEKDESYQATKNDPKVKAIIDDLTTKVTAGRAKLVRSANKILDEAAKEKLTQDMAIEAYSVGSVINMALGADSPDGKPVMDRIAKLNKDFADAGERAEAETAAYYKGMTEKADAAWPAMLAKFTVTDGFDPNNAAAMKGKYVKIVGNNLMGWRFKHGDFAYATRLNGLPVAGKYDPAIRDALKAVEDKLGRAIGDNDADGQWTAIARVEGGTGRLIELVKSSGNVTVDGTNVGTVEGTDERPVEAPIVTIVALKAGPVAASTNNDGPRSDAVPAPSSPNAGSTGNAAAAAVGGAPLAVTSTSSAGAGRGIGNRLFAIVTGLFAVVLGGVALMKARFAPLATNAGAVQLTGRLGENNQTLLGFAGIGWGALATLMALLSITGAFVGALIGIVGGLAMVVSGFVISSDAPALAGVVKPDLAAKVKAFAVPAGLTCAALGALGLLLALIP